MSSGAIILAAGSAEGGKDLRPLICVGGRPMIRRIADTLAELSVSPVIVVTGSRQGAVRKCLSGFNAHYVFNRRYAATDMLASLKLGLKEIDRPGCERILVIPSDLPLVSANTISLLLQADGEAVIPSYNGQRGHPIVLSAAAAAKIEGFEGEGGLREAINTLTEPLVIPVQDRAVLMDVNSREEYNELAEYEAVMSGSAQLHLKCDFSLAVNKAVIDGDTILLLNMVDCTGSLQTASDCVGISYSKAWRQIKALERELNSTLVTSAAGGSGGGGTRLSEAAKFLVESYQNMLAYGRNVSKVMFDAFFSNEIVKKIQNQG